MSEEGNSAPSIQSWRYLKITSCVVSRLVRGRSTKWSNHTVVLIMLRRQIIGQIFKNKLLIAPSTAQGHLMDYKDKMQEDKEDR